MPISQIRKLRLRTQSLSKVIRSVRLQSSCPSPLHHTTPSKHSHVWYSPLLSALTCSPVQSGASHSLPPGTARWVSSVLGLKFSVWGAPSLASKRWVTDGGLIHSLILRGPLTLHLQKWNPAPSSTLKESQAGGLKLEYVRCGLDVHPSSKILRMMLWPSRSFYELLNMLFGDFFGLY